MYHRTRHPMCRQHRESIQDRRRQVHQDHRLQNIFRRRPKVMKRPIRCRVQWQMSALMIQWITTIQMTEVSQRDNHQRH